MIFGLRWHPLALKEFQRLGTPVQRQIRAKLEEVRANPHVARNKLSRQKDRYKIKLRSSGYRLVYEVRDAELLILVVAIGKRDRNQVYVTSAQR